MKRPACPGSGQVHKKDCVYKKGRPFPDHRIRNRRPAFYNRSAENATAIGRGTVCSNQYHPARCKGEKFFATYSALSSARTFSNPLRHSSSLG